MTIKMASALKEQGKNIQLEDLIFYKKLGAGMFGSVFLVKDKPESEQFYALKCVSKQQVVEQHLERHLQVAILHWRVISFFPWVNNSKKKASLKSSISHSSCNL